MSKSNVDLLYNGCTKIQSVADELYYLSKAHTVLGHDKIADDLCEMAATLIGAKANVKKAFSNELNRGINQAQEFNATVLSAVLKDSLHPED